jgi:TATA-box binding protein (TBP) (component of TFIID and TFIIIB)
MSSPASRVTYYPLTIRNFVCTGQLNESLSLRAVQCVTQARWDSEKFPSCVSVCKNTGTTNSFFDTGEILVTGAAKVEEGLYACWFAINKVNRDLGKDYSFNNFQIQNISSTFSLGYQLDLHRFYQDNRYSGEFGTVNYDPELFPGASLRPLTKPPCVFIVYCSGRGVLTGCKSVETAKQTYMSHLSLFEKYAKVVKVKSLLAHKSATSTSPRRVLAANNKRMRT